MKLTAAELARFERQVAAHPRGSIRPPLASPSSYAELVARRTALLERTP